MDTRRITSALLSDSVIAVPPLARNGDDTLRAEENLRLIRHLEAGGVRTLLYGGNALLNHVAASEYAELLAMLADSVAEETRVIPSVGPSFGLLRDQVDILRDFPFPTAMLLPTRDPTTPSGIASAVRYMANGCNRPAVLYLKYEGALDLATIRGLVADGVISWIKYAIVRQDTAADRFLRDLVEAVGPNLIVSGIGEQPAVIHMRDFGLASFTSGCVCLLPKQSTALLHAVQRKDFVRAEQIRQGFYALEALRDEISPVRVLHAAVRLAGICHTGHIPPPVSPISTEEEARVATAWDQMRQWNWEAQTC